MDPLAFTHLRWPAGTPVVRGTWQNRACAAGCEAVPLASWHQLRRSGAALVRVFRGFDPGRSAVWP